MSEPLKIFITYAHANAKEKDTLIRRLAVMVQQGEITIWHDNEILPGDRWREKISNNLADSDILLYLVSDYSLASENCNKELSDSLTKDSGISIIPIILETCDWKHQKLKDFQALPDKGKPINEWQPESKGWQNVVEGIRKVAKNIVDSREKSTPDQQDAEEHLADLGRQHLLSMGNFRMMLGQMEEAIEIYSYAIKLQPDFVEAYNNRGIAFKNQGELDRAIQDYDKAIDLKPDYADAYINRGNAYSGKGEHDRAIQDCDKAINLKPDYADAYINRGNAYRDKGDFDRAIQDFDKAIDLKPDYADAYINRGNAYSGKGEHDRAIQDYDKAIELKPNFAEAYINRGNAYGNKGELDQAIQDYNEAINLKPDFAEAYFNRGNAYSGKGDFDRTIQDYNEAIRLKPNDAEAYNNRGVAYIGKGGFDQAIQDFNKVIDLKPNYAEAYNGRGVAYIGKGNFDQAIQDFDKAIELNPNYAEAHNNRGIAYYNRGIVGLISGEWEKARADLTIAQNMGVDIVAMFRIQHGSVADFEQRYGLVLPEVIRTIEGKKELSDPLLSLAGTLTCDATNIGEKHDEYIGQALMKEMRDADNE